MRLGYSIQNHAGSRGVAAVGSLGGPGPAHQLFLAEWINSWTKFLQNFKNVQVYMKDAKCADMNKKSVFRFLAFEIWSFLYLKLVNFLMIFEYKIDHTSKT